MSEKKIKDGCRKRMLELNKKKAAEKNPNILKQLETQITTTDRQIDRLPSAGYLIDLLSRRLSGSIKGIR